VSAVAVGRLGDRDVIVSGALDRTVRIWNATGRPIRKPLTGHTREVSAVAVGRLGDRLGDHVGSPLIGHSSGVSAVAVGRLGDRDIIVSGGFDGRMWIFDATGEPVGAR
jgi:WD40 repeat protein